MGTSISDSCTMSLTRWLRRSQVHVADRREVGQHFVFSPVYHGDSLSRNPRPRAKSSPTVQHKAITFEVERVKERQEWNEQKLAKALPGHSGGRLPRRCKELKGREEEEECVKSEQGQKKIENI